MATIDDVRDTSRRGDGSAVLAWAVLIASILEVVAPVVTINGPGASPGDGSGPELLITPVGWAFSIWGVIYSLAIAQAVMVLVAGGRSVPRRLQVAQVALYLAGALWVVLAAFDSSVATAVALLLMLVAGVDAVVTAARHPTDRPWLTLLTRSSIGLYAGWVTAAFFLNLSTALVDSGSAEASGLAWQVVVLIVAVVALLALLVAARGVLAYAIAGAWALVGIAVTGATNGTTTVTAVSVTSAVVLAATAVLLRLLGRHPTTSEQGRPGHRAPTPPGQTTEHAPPQVG